MYKANHRGSVYCQ